MPGEQQHYVPRFLLKNFTQGKKLKIFVYDKSNDSCFQTNIKNIAAEKRFYDLQLEEKVLSMEPALSRLENNTSDIIRKLIKTRDLKSLGQNQVAILALFLAVQFVRTKEYRLICEHMGKQLTNMLREMGSSEEQIKKMIGGQTDETGRKLFGMIALDRAKELIPHFLNKAWILFETTLKHPFFISDNPIGLHNDFDHGPYGNIGLAVKGIQIYLPLSSTLCLHLLCPTIAEEFRKAYVNLQDFEKNASGCADGAMTWPARFRAFCGGFMNGTPIQVSEDNVTMINSLQVVFSSRFVYCESNKFELIKTMIGDNPKFREGLKPVMA